MWEKNHSKASKENNDLEHRAREGESRGTMREEWQTEKKKAGERKESGGKKKGGPSAWRCGKEKGWAKGELRLQTGEYKTKREKSNMEKRGGRKSSGGGTKIGISIPPGENGTAEGAREEKKGERIF